MRRLLAPVLVVLLAAAACGGGEGAVATGDLRDAPATTDATTSTAPPSSAASTTTTVAETTAPPETAPTTDAVTTVPAAPVESADGRVFVLGDSALLGARETVPAALAGWRVTFDAVGSRRLPQGIEVLRARRAEIGDVVVIQQGNNFIAAEGSFAAQIDEAMRVLDGVDRVVWLTVAEKWPSRVEINAAIRATPQRWPQAVVADWAAVIAAHPEYAGDMLHLSASGASAIAQLIARHVGPR